MAGLLPSWLLTPVAGRVGVACKLDTMMTLPSPIASRLFISASLRLVIAPCVALLLCAAATAPLAALARDKPLPPVYEAQVTRVSDGDSVWVQPLWLTSATV